MRSLAALSAQAAAIYAAAPDHWQFEQLVKRAFLCVEGLLVKFNDAAGEVNAVNTLNEPDDSEIVFASNVHADIERVLTVHEIGFPLFAALVFARAYEVV